MSGCNSLLSLFVKKSAFRSCLFQASFVQTDYDNSCPSERILNNLPGMSRLFVKKFAFRSCLFQTSFVQTDYSNNCPSEQILNNLPGMSRFCNVSYGNCLLHLNIHLQVLRRLFLRFVIDIKHQDFNDVLFYQNITSFDQP